MPTTTAASEAVSVAPDPACRKTQRCRGAADLCAASTEQTITAAPWSTMLLEVISLV